MTRFESPEIDTRDMSRYIQTASFIDAVVPLIIEEVLVKVRKFGGAEAAGLATSVRKRNVFSRHSWEQDFYVSRTKELSGKTVIEVYRIGDPNETIEESRRIADYIEKICALSASFAYKRRRLQLLLDSEGVSERGFNISYGPDMRYLRSKSEPRKSEKTIQLNAGFNSRFEKCGFKALAVLLSGTSDLSNRVGKALDWLFESKQEVNFESAVVKTGIALETLLGLEENEPLRRSLSERAAFILSQEPVLRHTISKIIKTFYDLRSRVVHTGRRGPKSAGENLLEGVDRLTLLLCLVFGSNSKLWPSVNTLRDWCETQRWGEPAREVTIPFPNRYRTTAIQLSLK